MQNWNTYKKQVIPFTYLVKDKLEIDWDLFKDLLNHRSITNSKEELIFRNWLKKWIETNIKNVIAEVDKFGNLYITKGITDLYPCIIAHVDINQDKCDDFDIILTDRYMFGFDNISGQQQGLGFDDKVGIMFGLMMLQKLDNLKCFFPLAEEIGAIGSKNAEMEFFLDCSMLVQLDRNSYNNDISESTNGITVVTEEFKKASYKILNGYSYKYTKCMFTDVGELIRQKAGCIGFNLSCGYFNEHAEDEILSIVHFKNAINLAYELIKELGYKKRWKIEVKENAKYEGYNNKAVYGTATYPMYDEGYEKSRWEDASEYQITADELTMEAFEDNYCENCCVYDVIQTIDEDEKKCSCCGITYFIPDHLKNYTTKSRSIHDMKDEEITNI